MPADPPSASPCAGTGTGIASCACRREAAAASGGRRAERSGPTVGSPSRGDAAAGRGVDRGGMAEPEVRRALPLWLIVVLGAAGRAVAIWGIRAAAPILGPLFLAFVLTVTVHPLVGALVRRGMRRGL